jgi:hypothetical protein
MFSSSWYPETGGIEVELCFLIRYRDGKWHSHGRKHISLYSPQYNDQDWNFMFLMPDFIETNEEWIIWLLYEEFNGRATLVMLSERTHISPDQVTGHIERLEQMKAIAVTRDPHTKKDIISVGITPVGKSLFMRIQERSTPSDR